MAEIRVEKKRPVWPWLLVIIVLAILAFLYFYGSTETDDNNETETIDDVTAMTIPQHHVIQTKTI
ncbi:hypothetical protein [Christiangramia flava]|uniref:Uncharacterized protein n=1 Tax=Christiangramia flava JLT2011 TaxID=1229726 RepID=A0A1L7I946_9FLAO|nr:hypothetical protein [Christiangramia flava]APU69642.1 hypothetical protein GRFL_2918 [Christiangramia flava JLT2011]OSS39327.1 secreted protein [Christiangramia flava JLT2011]